MRDIISPDTNLDLNYAAERITTLQRSRFFPVGNFATLHSGVEIGDPLTAISVCDKALAVSTIGQGITRFFAHIDLDPTGPATFVRPGLYNANGQWDPVNGLAFARPPIRPLTENEGRALVQDLRIIFSTAIIDELGDHTL